MATWIRDDGYSGEETARRGDFAAVICPPEYTDSGWGIQVFDEADDDAMRYGEIHTMIENLPTPGAAKRIAEDILAELDAARIDAQL